MAIAKVPRSIGAANATPAYARARTYESMVPHAGFNQDIVRKHAASCVGSNPRMSHKWMCSMWMAIKTMSQFTI